MSDTIIKVENLSERYVLGAQRNEKERYIALRDVMAREARAPKVDRAAWLVKRVMPIVKQKPPDVYPSL